MTETVWRNKPYGLMIASQTFSSFADWMFLLSALTIAGVHLNASSIEMSLLMLAFILPQLLISPIAGSLSDRFDRKRVIILSNIGRSVVVLCVPFAVFSMWQLMIIMGLLSTFSSLFIPAKNGKLKEILSDDQLQQGVAISGMIDNASKVLGPSLSGFLLVLFSTQSLFLFISGSYVLSVLTLLFLNKSVPIEQTEEKPAVSFSQGFREIRAHTSIYTGLMVLATCMFFLQLVDSQLVIFLTQTMHSAEQTLGMAIAASGFGTLIAAFYLSKKPLVHFEKYQRVATGVLGCSFLFILVVSVLPEELMMVLIPICFLFGGGAFGCVLVSFQIYVQKTIPVKSTGRIFGAISSVTSGASIFGLLLGGVKAELFGVQFVYFVVGTALVLLSLDLFIKQRAVARRNRQNQTM
ncbi:MFS transporter [Geomicrobium sp. JCM 19039]|uniref:MFS transporter n=1 Tax=Geomicrobium sp. JCM 19039 TaxID=1460636 RepID=UPI00045F3CE6|nr:MFS transporter [Geomicrobium sp. JCM 19039]GAK11093.1 permease [Geomicrobium sp. JCM 19039]